MADAACNCGAPYVPAGRRAAEAVATNPEKSDRAIAAEIGVDRETVARARKIATGACCQLRSASARMVRRASCACPARTVFAAFHCLRVGTDPADRDREPEVFAGTKAKADDLKTLAGFLIAVADLQDDARNVVTLRRRA